METYVRPPRTGMEAFEMMPEGTLCQLINNKLIMSPAPSPDHQSVSSVIFEQISIYVKTRKSGKIFYAPIDVYLNNANVFQPDIVFIEQQRTQIIDWKRGIFGAPDLIIEILSRNRNYDLKKKKDVYESSGVKEYWVVDPETKWCEGFVLQNGVYQTTGEYTATLTIQMFNLSITF